MKQYSAVITVKSDNDPETRLFTLSECVDFGHLSPNGEELKLASAQLIEKFKEAWPHRNIRIPFHPIVEIDIAARDEEVEEHV